MSILSWETHQSVAGHMDMLEKFKDFMDGIGWTVDHFEKDKEWLSAGGGNYSFQAGSEMFVQLSSSAFEANQATTWRFRAFSGGTTNQYIQMTHTIIGSETFATNTSEHPVDQDEYLGQGTGVEKTGFHPTSIPQVWFFGNTTFGCIVAKLDANFVQYLTFGSLILFDATMAGGTFNCSTLNSGTSETPWTDYTDGTNIFRAPFNEVDDESYDPIVHAGSLRVAYQSVDASYDTPQGTYFNRSQELFFPNTLVGKRLMYESIVFRDNGTGLPLGKWPIFKCNVEGLAIGETVKQGSDEYIVFPNCYKSCVHGIAFRVA